MRLVCVLDVHRARASTLVRPAARPSLSLRRARGVSGEVAKATEAAALAALRDRDPSLRTAALRVAAAAVGAAATTAVCTHAAETGSGAPSQVCRAIITRPPHPL